MFKILENGFEDRRAAGRALAERIAAQPGLGPAIALALPRGGVPVAYEVARALHLPLDVLMVRKLGAPGQRELAIGAVASGGIVVLNSEYVQAFHVSGESLRAMIEREQQEIARREQAYRSGAPPIPVEGRAAILIDDGLATGATMRAAARAVRPRAAQVIIAVPIAADSTCRELESEADRMICLETAEDFQAVGQFYRDFRATPDEEVRELLADARTRVQSPAP